jgi:hypothetical protein
MKMASVVSLDLYVPPRSLREHSVQSDRCIDAGAEYLGLEMEIVMVREKFCVRVRKPLHLHSEPGGAAVA